MPSLADKLKTLGVKLGSEHQPEPLPKKHTSIEEILTGEILNTSMGETYLVEERFPIGSPYGRSKLELNSPLNRLAQCLGEPDLAVMSAESLVFVDTETTGLSGGTGTFTFLIGAGRFIKDEFVLVQFFLRGPQEEAAQLLAFEQFLAPCQSIVTFNGKSFDVPLLRTRFLTHSWQPPFGELIHVDLLHLARRLWRDRIPNRALGNLEVQILDADRTEEDVPGWMIPALYFEYLQDGDAARLKPVFYHNKMDVISLAVLMDHIAQLLTEPLISASAYGADLISLARLFEAMDDLSTAADLYSQGINHEDASAERIPLGIIVEALQRLARIHKRDANFDDAIDLWQRAAQLQGLDAHEELAKYYEHHLGDFNLAIHWTEKALNLLELLETPTGSLTAPKFTSNYERIRWREQLNHRLNRLHRKVDKTG